MDQLIDRLTASGAPFEDDFMLPSQFHDMLSRSSDRTPEHRLIAAVLEDALRCWLRMPRECNSVHTTRRSLAVAAEQWIFEDRECLLPFEDVCTMLSIDAGWLRDALRKLPKDPPPTVPGRIRNNVKPKPMLRAETYRSNQSKVAALHRQGLSTSAIAAEVGINQRTVQRYLNAPIGEF